MMLFQTSQHAKLRAISLSGDLKCRDLSFIVMQLSLTRRIRVFVPPKQPSAIIPKVFQEPGCLVNQHEDRSSGVSFRRYAHWSALLVLAGTAKFICPQAGDLAAIQQALSSQFKLTTITANRSDITNPGDVVQINKPGLVMYSIDSPLPPSNTYKNGKIGQGWAGFGKDLAITMAAPGSNTATNYPHRTFAVQENCWVTAVLAQKDGILFQLYSDPYDNIRYYGNLKIPFPNKKEIPSADAVMQLVSEVLTNVSAGGQGGQPAPEPVASGTDQSAQSSFEGRYYLKNSPGDSLLLGPNGTFTLLQKGKMYEGNYSVADGVLTLWGPKIKGQPRCHLAGNTITDPDGSIWEKPAGIQEQAAATTQTPTPQAALPAPALSDIAPPPPPADAAPPPAPASTAPAPTVSMGQTMDQVIVILGAPKSVSKAGANTVFVYSDLKVTFTNGKVSDVE